MNINKKSDGSHRVIVVHKPMSSFFFVNLLARGLPTSSLHVSKMIYIITNITICSVLQQSVVGSKRIFW